MNIVPLNTIIIALVVVAAMIVVIAWGLYATKAIARTANAFRSRIRSDCEGARGRSRAESGLKERESRVARLNITPLTASEAARFAQAWNNLQSRFIDNPKGALAEAHHLVTELLQKRAYPTGDFEGRAADISVDYPSVAAPHRAARDIEARDKRGEADTEELRQAIVHYRTLLGQLLEVEVPNAHAARIAVNS